MSTSEDHILRERRPAESLIPALDGSLYLSEKQIEFLLHAICDVDPDALDAETEIRKRVLEVQSKAYQTYPYPCIRVFHHVCLFMSENDAFPHILKAGQSAGQANAPLLLDIGCCMGTDLRHLVQSGYPSASVIGCDVRADFIDLGHALYTDHNTCPIPFFVADVFDITLRPFPQATDTVSLSLEHVRNLNELRGRLKYIYAGALFHLFDEGTQEAIARRLATLLDVTEGSGQAVIFGRHSGKAEECIMDDTLGRIRYAHSPESWKRLWGRVLGGKNIPVHVDAELHIDWHGQADDAKTKWLLASVDTEMMFWSVWVGQSPGYHY